MYWAVYKQLPKRLTIFYLLIGVTWIYLAIFGLQYYWSECPSGAIVTVSLGGNLGNRIWEYMSLYAASCLYRNTYPYVDPIIKTSLEEIFEGISIPTTNELSTICAQMRHPYVIGLTDTIDNGKVNENYHLQLEKYSARYMDVVKCGIDRMKDELRFKSSHLDSTHATFESLAKSFNYTATKATFISVHFRGNDYHYLLSRNYLQYKLELPTHSYYNKAMHYFHTKFDNVIFIFITIDHVWLKHTKPYLNPRYNIVINPNGADRVKDLTLMAHCNHSILSYGTFAATAALFAKGITFVYDLHVPLDGDGPTLAMGLSEVLPNWYRIGN